MESKNRIKEISVGEIESLIGKEAGVSDWVNVSQERINQFADVTEDHQFIHIDVERAAKTPFGGTIAHGLLTLSLLPKFAQEALAPLANVKMGINYGYDKIRFLNPVPSGSKVRGRFTLVQAVEKQPGRWMFSYDVTVEIEDMDKPALAARWITMSVIG